MYNKAECGFSRFKSLSFYPIIDNLKPNTIEFRLFNGTVNYLVLRENVLLAGSHVQNCKLHSISPQLKKHELDLFFEKDLPEKEKLIRYLNFLFGNNEKYKNIFYNRWVSKVGKLDYRSVRENKGELSYKKQYYPEKKECEEHEI